MELTSLQREDFDRQTREGLVVVMFWAPWCQTCKWMTPALEELAEEFSGEVWFCKVHAEEESDLAEAWAVRGLPTILILKDGTEAKRLTGYQQKDRLLFALMPFYHNRVIR